MGKEALTTAEVAEIIHHDLDYPRMVHCRGYHYVYEGGSYRKVEDAEMHYRVIDYMAAYLPDEPSPSAQFVRLVAEAIAQRTWVDGKRNQPFWLPGAKELEDGEM